MLKNYFKKQKTKRENEIAELEDVIFEKRSEIKVIEHALKNKELNLKQREQEFELALERKKQVFTLAQEKKSSLLEIELDGLKTKFEDAKAKFEEDKSRLQEIAKEKYDKDMAILDLSKQQELAKLKNDNEKALIKLEAKYSDELARKSKEMQDDNYKKIQEAFTKFNSEGNATTKFMQEITTSLISSSKSLPNQNDIKLGINVNKEALDTTSTTINS